jgi:hypothetical protein
MGQGELVFEARLQHDMEGGGSLQVLMRWSMYEIIGSRCIVMHDWCTVLVVLQYKIFP